MKKVYKMESFDTSSVSSENIANKTHWFVNGIDKMLQMLGIGTYTFQYKSNYIFTLRTNNFGNFDIAVPQLTVAQTLAYCFYVNTDEKELIGVAGLANTFNSEDSHTTGSSPSNYVRGCLAYSTSGSGNYTMTNNGGFLQLKFENGTIKGCSTRSGMFASTSSGSFVPSHIGVCLGQNYKSQATPIGLVGIKYTNAPIVYRNASENFPAFYGEYFESIFICDKYFVGALKSTDNTKFIFDGYLFIVDDARDIEVIETTV